MNCFDKLILISAFNDSGGAYTHRLFDGHPELFCWPFELQLGTAASEDSDLVWLKGKFRWPKFVSGSGDAMGVFSDILDTELKGRLLSPHTSKFRDFRINVDVSLWAERFCQLVASGSKEFVKCYIMSFFAVDRELVRSGYESCVLGHCPNIVFDAEKVLSDFPQAKILNIVRCPIAGFADMRVRNPLLKAAEYAERWSAINLAAGVYEMTLPQSVRNFRLVDIITDTEGAMLEICRWLSLTFDRVLISATWRGEGVAVPGPFGGLRGVGVGYEEARRGLVGSRERVQLLDGTAEARAKLRWDVVSSGEI